MSLWPLLGGKLYFSLLHIKTQSSVKINFSNCQPVTTIPAPKGRLEPETAVAWIEHVNRPWVKRVLKPQLGNRALPLITEAPGMEPSAGSAGFRPQVCEPRAVLGLRQGNSVGETDTEMVFTRLYRDDQMWACLTGQR